MIEVSAYKWVPPGAQGLVRDLRIRWALEEAGLPYRIKLIALGPEQDAPDYRAMQPFGQVPAYREDDLTLFESGAIALHIAEKSDALMPCDPIPRQQTIQWLFAALNTIEPPIMFLQQLNFKNVSDGPLRETALAWTTKRLTELARTMQSHSYLAGDRFTVADLMMSTVLDQLRNSDMVAKEPVLAAWHEACRARPGYKKAFADQMAAFKDHT
ncbi:MAG TPA: glutathione S-transferase family protein [Rhizomicrobium sp.]|jgi:glutathione S-transferase